MKRLLRDRLFEPFQRAVRELPWFGPAVSAVLIALAVNMLTETLTALGGPMLGWAAVAVLFLIAFGFAYLYSQTPRGLLMPLDFSQPPPMPGLIFLVSREETLRKALDHHRNALKHCWLLATPEAETTANQFIIQNQNQYPEVRFHLEPVQNAFSAQESYQIVRRIYQTCEQETGVPAAQVISDITGGTKPMTTGMVMACLEGRYPMEHIPAQYDANLRAMVPLPPIEIQVERT